MSNYKRADNLGTWIFTAGLAILAIWAGYKIYQDIQAHPVTILPQ